MELNIQDNMIKPKLILFDVNGTLLNLADLKKKVNKLLDSKRGFTIWLEMLLHYTLVDNATGSQHPFESIARATLEMAAHSPGSHVSHIEIEQLFGVAQQLPLHESIQEGLSLFHDQGFRLAALTNLPLDAV